MQLINRIYFWDKFNGMCLKRVKLQGVLSFLLSAELGRGGNTKYCPFIVSPRVDKPAADCELEPNNQSAVVSIVMLSPMGKKERQRDT